MHLPLKLKYACPSQSTWKMAVDLLLSVMHNGLSVHIQSGGKLDFVCILSFFAAISASIP